MQKFKRWLIAVLLLTGINYVLFAAMIYLCMHEAQFPWQYEPILFRLFILYCPLMGLWLGSFWVTLRR